MKVVIQRVSQAQVSVEQQAIATIERGFVLLVGISASDTFEDITYAVRKIVNMRLFEDSLGKMNLSIKEIEGSILSVSQFTLLANTKKGNRPSFTQAAKPEMAKELYQQFNRLLEEEGVSVVTGQFQAHMMVSLVNDGPVTIVLDTQER